VSDYGLDDRATGLQSLAEAKDFSLASVSRPALTATQSSIQWVPGILSPGVKLGWGVTLTAHSHLVSMSRMSRSYNAFIPCRLYDDVGTTLLLLSMLTSLTFLCLFSFKINYYYYYYYYILKVRYFILRDSHNLF